MRKLRVGIIGFGNIARAHLAAYRSQPDVEVAAVAEPVETSRQDALRVFGIPRAVETWDELLALDGIDAVSICTPHDLHEEPFVAAARAGKHVLVEKPISISLASANRMLRSAAEAGIWAALGTPLRYYPANIEIKRLLQAGRLGAPELIKVSYGANAFRRDEHGTGARREAWSRSSKRMGGGTLSGQTVHYFSLLTWMLEAQVKAVTAVTWNVGNAIGGDPAFDTNVVCVLEFETGTRALIETSWSSHQHPWGIEVYGSKGTLVGTSTAGSQYSYTLSLHGPAAGLPPEQQALPAARVVIGDPTPPPLPPYGHTEICADFIATIRNGRIMGDMPTAAHGRDLQAIIDAGYLSSRQGRRVTIAEVEAAALAAE